MHEHPLITRTLRTGYPVKENVIRDRYGSELIPGDSVIEFEGEIVHRDNLYEFLQAIGFTFKTL